jgi:ribosomal protein S18 acetylase RimI-like enzyme
MAEDEGAAAGYVKIAAMTLPVDHPQGSLEIKQLYVLAPWQGKGVAQVLMDWAIDTARDDGTPALYLSVWSQNARAIAFYRRYGFVVAGTAPFAVGGQIDEDPVMRLDLA